ncbi:hypothetical protein GCM10023195_15000 [Actinoallomurus liliacearum]|uniref:Uncharacterized protein n=1 Tax=Actinoallomurus liliacearum TaxID=1080073 RepID=A0ABP8TFD3_9ACTN
MEGDLSRLTDDEEFNRQFREAVDRWKELSGRDQQLDTEHQVTARTLETLAARHRELSDKARGADGRTVAQAKEEEADARAALEQALTDKGAAEAVEKQARDQLESIGTAAQRPCFSKPRAADSAGSAQ